MTTTTSHFRDAIAAYIRAEARPIDKFSHQPRLYQLATQIGEGQEYDDDILYAAAWLHDLGVFIGHRPADLAALSRWDNTAYVLRVAPEQLRQCGFPPEKIGGVLAAIESHQPAGQPTTIEGILLRDADILEQLGAIIVLRTVAKIGRDIRFHVFADAIAVLQQNLSTLPTQIRLERARTLAQPRIAILRQFLEAAQAESLGIAL